jgi:glycosyltransferase involved in cell wall biosynthesis
MGKKHMKILFFTCFFQQGYGVHLVIKKQLQGLLANGFNELYLAVRDFDEKENEKLDRRVKVFKAESNYNSVKDIMMKVKPDVVVVHTPPYWSHIARFNEFFTIKIAYDYGDPFPTFYDGKEKKERENSDKAKYNGIPNYHVHISISEFIKRCSGISSSTVIYCGADHVDGQKNENEYNIRDYLGMMKSSFIISSLSRIGIGESFYKGFDALIKIKERVFEKLGNRNIVFLIMGKSAPKGNKIEKMLQQAGFFLLENVDEKLKKNILKQSDLFISPSLWEGFNLPLVEAQYMGSPALCFSIGAHPEVCPFHFINVEEMVNFIVLLYNNDQLRRKYGYICQNYVRKKFKWENNVNMLISILKSCTGHKKRLSTLKNPE